MRDSLQSVVALVFQLRTVDALENRDVTWRWPNVIRNQKPLFTGHFGVGRHLLAVPCDHRLATGMDSERLGFDGEPVDVEFRTQVGRPGSRVNEESTRVD